MKHQSCDHTWTQQTTTSSEQRFAFCSFISPKLFCYVSVQLVSELLRTFEPEHFKLGLLLKQLCPSSSSSSSQQLLSVMNLLATNSRTVGVCLSFGGRESVSCLQSPDSNTDEVIYGPTWQKSRTNNRTAFWEICWFAIESWTDGTSAEASSVSRF